MVEHVAVELDHPPGDVVHVVGLDVLLEVGDDCETVHGHGADADRDHEHGSDHGRHGLVASHEVTTRTLSRPIVFCVFGVVSWPIRRICGPPVTSDVVSCWVNVV
jgi:hypothetical protein